MNASFRKPQQNPQPLRNASDQKEEPSFFKFKRDPATTNLKRPLEETSLCKLDALSSKEKRLPRNTGKKIKEVTVLDLMEIVQCKGGVKLNLKEIIAKNPSAFEEEVLFPSINDAT